MNLDVRDDEALGIPRELSQAELFDEAIRKAFKLGEEIAGMSGGPLMEYALAARMDALAACVAMLSIKTTDPNVLALQVQARPYVDLMLWMEKTFNEGIQAQASLEVEQDEQREFEEEQNGE